jgi:anti-sigma regulatory factor (Ser/Thr protein kinase)
MPHGLELPRGSAAPRLARQAITRWCGHQFDRSEVEDAKLIASELVTNAVKHGRGRIRLTMEIDEDRMLIEVTDDGSGFEHAIREVPFDQLSGRGLAIVDATSSRWGIHEGTTHVWAEVERAGPRLGANKKP